jgi:hypothetical protein
MPKEVLTEGKVAALLVARPSTKREITDHVQHNLCFVIGPKVAKWMVRYRSPVTRENVKLTISKYGSIVKPWMDLATARSAANAVLFKVTRGDDPRENRLTAMALKRRNDDDTSTDYIAEAITEAWGERCPDFGPDCPCCRAWKQYDDIRVALKAASAGLDDSSPVQKLIQAALAPVPNKSALR